MNEVWNDIAGFEGLYQVSNLGQVRSLPRNTTNGKILKPRNSNGYLQVELSKNGKKKMFKVHRLVANAFIPNPRNWPEVNHRDEDKTNNRADNLEFCTRKYNINFGTGIARRAAKQSKSILQYDEDCNLVKTWPSASEVKRQLGFNQGNISACCRGERGSANGYIWRYA